MRHIFECVVLIIIENEIKEGFDPCNHRGKFLVMRQQKMAIEAIFFGCEEYTPLASGGASKL